MGPSHMTDADRCKPLNKKKMERSEIHLERGAESWLVIDPVL